MMGGMSDEHIAAANQILTFSDVMRDPERNLIEDILDPIVHCLERSGMPRHKVADVLFEHVLSQSTPSEEITSGNAVIWLVQLEAFRDALQARIDGMDIALGDYHNDTPK